ncbi:MAG: hypothetical protein E3J35_06245 [Methanomassiliicoccales archaeon]|nr:MAG: hypothetical protein E3J35_06245 [Methanomassiliicoccales archaeon]
MRRRRPKSLEDMYADQERELYGDLERLMEGPEGTPDRVVPIARHGDVVIIKRVTGAGEEIRERAVIVDEQEGHYLLRRGSGAAMFVPKTPETRRFFDRGQTYVMRGSQIKAKDGSVSAYTTDRSLSRDSDAHVVDWCRRNDVSNTYVRYAEEGGKIFITSIDDRPTRIRVR